MICGSRTPNNLSIAACASLTVAPGMFTLLLSLAPARARFFSAWQSARSNRRLWRELWRDRPRRPSDALPGSPLKEVSRLHRLSRLFFSISFFLPFTSRFSRAGLIARVANRSRQPADSAAQNLQIRIQVNHAFVLAACVG